MKSDHIELDCEAGPILLGPGTPEIIDQLATSIRDYLGEAPKDRLVTLESLKSGE